MKTSESIDKADRSDVLIVFWLCGIVVFIFGVCVGWFIRWMVGG